MRRFATWVMAAALAACSSAPSSEDPPHQWRIEVQGGADKQGEIVLAFVEDGVDVSQVPAAIPKGTPENAVADRIRRALRRALPKDQYVVDLAGGEKIFIGALDHAKDYEIRFVRNTVPGTEVRIFRE